MLKAARQEHRSRFQRAGARAHGNQPLVWEDFPPLQQRDYAPKAAQRPPNRPVNNAPRPLMDPWGAPAPGANVAPATPRAGASAAPAAPTPSAAPAATATAGPATAPLAASEAEPATTPVTAAAAADPTNTHPGPLAASDSTSGPLAAESTPPAPAAATVATEPDRSDAGSESDLDDAALLEAASIQLPGSETEDDLEPTIDTPTTASPISTASTTSTRSSRSATRTGTRPRQERSERRLTRQALRDQ